MLQKQLHSLIHRLHFRYKPAILVASHGRAGSTLLYEAVLEAANGRLPQRYRIPNTFVAEIDDMALVRGRIVKTHDFPKVPPRYAGPLRAVFVFGSLVESALSVHARMAASGPDWIAAHFRHLHADGGFDELLKRDVLRQAEQIERWSRFDGFPVLCVRYDAMWAHVDRIASFTRMPLRLPPRRPRVEKQVPDALVAQARQTYGALDSRFAALPDCFVAGPAVVV